MLILIERVRSLKRIDWIDQSVVSFIILTFSPQRSNSELLTLY